MKNNDVINICKIESRNKIMFTEDMTYAEAVIAFFKESDGKSREERKQIQEDFKHIMKIIMQKEHDTTNTLNFSCHSKYV